MRTIGLIGGMSWESTAVYYSHINEEVRNRLGGLVSARIAMQSLDFSEVVALQKADRWHDAGMLLADAARRLELGGADCVLICTNTMHLVAEPVSAAVNIPLIDIRAETGRALADAGMKRPLLLATRYTMEHGFYADYLKTHFGLDLLVPNEIDRAKVHSVIFDELCCGVVKPESRQALEKIVERGKDAGADCVILGCTEICLSLTEDNLALPLFDSTAIHARAAVDHALERSAAAASHR
ncbi:aspartate/glutamate racemase family protein [Phyllobacterium sp. 0TCS1.6C]|uniref:aspartate/glutamate racemase family protein n=1 Tax=unclassified Phyllobacterium TaxID=2638441 RepID=UPI002263D9E3|nr:MULTISPECIES: aspartate/glutamate racemase family protein [unclassified Phyllobacterium]MCX8282279.1 aspartate/glutamate racemase family protein [Phyllobacterium sp. 0TCS1.6C]MCX8292095.1 aspartate/glutamate racemase family protein [Phyllobacterium sp. 0TCS1.6A]